jgi:hypothetical protein
MCRLVAVGQVGRAFLEDVVLNDWSGRKLSAKFRDPLSVAHQIDFGQPEFFSLGHVLRSFLR